jgi:hypothetical protein
MSIILIQDKKCIHHNYINQLTKLRYLNLCGSNYIKDDKLSTQLRQITVRVQTIDEPEFKVLF